jgi:plastocyanin
VATASTATATASAAATTAGPPTSFIFRTEHGAVPDGAVEIIADDGKFDVHAIDAKPGRLVVHLSNIEDFDVRHDFLITDQQQHRLARSDKVAAGDDIVFVVEDLKPGTYPYLCTLEGHAAAGMKGVLTVSEG